MLKNWAANLVLRQSCIAPAPSSGRYLDLPEFSATGKPLLPRRMAVLFQSSLLSKEERNDSTSTTACNVKENEYNEVPPIRQSGLPIAADIVCPEFFPIVPKQKGRPQSLWAGRPLAFE
jgi:hypothetical protein